MSRQCTNDQTSRRLASEARDENHHASFNKKWKFHMGKDILKTVYSC